MGYSRTADEIIREKALINDSPVGAVTFSYKSSIEGVRQIDAASANKGTIDNADAFIEKNNNWKVMLSNLFARIHSMFKTTTATQIDAFKKLKQEIEPHKEECSKMIEELKSEMNKITQGVNPSESIKDKLESQSALSSSNSIANFKDIRARFQGMIKAMPNVNEATLKEENQEQSQYTAVAP